MGKNWVKKCGVVARKTAPRHFTPSRAREREVRTFYPRSAHFSTERCAPLVFGLVTRGFRVDLGCDEFRAFLV